MSRVQEEYRRRDEDEGYRRRDEDEGYRRRDEDEGYRRRDEDEGYRRRDDDEGYRRRRDDRDHRRDNDDRKRGRSDKEAEQRPRNDSDQERRRHRDDPGRRPLRDRLGERDRPYEVHGESRSKKSRGFEVWEGSGLSEDPNLKRLSTLPDVDPRRNGPWGKAQKAAAGIQGQTGRNTQSFDPASTLVRPQMRITVGSKDKPTYGKPLKHDDVVIVPEFFCKEDDWGIYYKLLEEMAEIQSGKVAPSRDATRGSEWISWHEGAHLISKNPKGSKLYQMIQDKMGDYFGIKKSSRGTRFNWYRDSSDWKPFHHDSAAFNPQRAANQNCTVGISFGSERELAFLHAKDSDMKLYFPQKNGTLFYFGRDVNINWKHGVNAISREEQEQLGQKGRISIILWGLAEDTVDEEGSPPMLTNDARNGFDNRKPRTGDAGSGGGGGGGGPPCRDFARGRCSYGDRCRFSHS